MSRFLVVATAGAGGDLPPLVAAALALGDRDHEIAWVGDRSVSAMLARLGIECRALPADLDLGPRLASAVRDAMLATGGEVVAAGPLVEDRLADWASEVAAPVAEACAEVGPDAAVTSLFGVEVFGMAALGCPWAVINSTFYLGPNPPSPLEQDVAPRAVPVLRRYAGLLGSADLVLHATDPVFDHSFTGLPPRHHYVGPLGVWEPATNPPAYLDEPGDPWVLVSLSSQLQDDVPLAQAALEALAEFPVRVLVTVGPDHRPDEILDLPANARVETTVPHSAVLRRSRLLVSHAGHGTVMKALWEGRPMLLVPWGRDQPGVAGRAEALGVAITIPREAANAAAIRGGIDRVLGDTTMQTTATRHAKRLQPTDPQNVAAELLARLADARS